MSRLQLAPDIADRATRLRYVDHGPVGNVPAGEPCHRGCPSAARTDTP